MARARLLVLSLLVVSLAFADDPNPARAQYEAGLAAMADRDWDGARRAFDAAVQADPKADFAEEASFLSAKALDLGRRDEEAAKAYQQFLASHPNSPLAARARFLAADVYSRMKRWNDAAEVVRPETLALAGEERRQTLAKFYADLANEFYVAPDPSLPFPRRLGEVKPPADFGRALGYFAKAVEVTGPTPELLLSSAWCRLRLQDWDGADAVLRDLVQRFPKHALRGDAFYCLGYIAYVKDDAAKARELLSILPDEYGDSALCPASQFLFGLTYKPQETSDEDAYKKGLAAWAEFEEKYASHPLAPEVMMWTAQSQARWKDYVGAIATMTRFLARFPQDARAPEAQFGIGQAALALGKYDDASAAFQKFLASYPNDKQWQEAQTAVVEVAWQKGLHAVEEKKYDDAIAVWQDFLRQFPLSDHCAEIQFRFGEIASERDKDAEAIAEWEKTRSKYAKSEFAGKAALQIAQTNENVLARNDEDMEKVAKLYREVVKAYPGTESANEAAQRLTKLLEKTLEIKVERAYATNEKAILSVRTRNVKKLAFRAYRIDLEEYFRKKQGIAGVDKIAVEIVKPDQTWEQELEGYLPYRLFGHDIAMPLEGEGAWIVTVSTVGEENSGAYTATALLVRSDLALVTKSTQNQVLVFARNEVTGKPWPGARVLLSDGASVRYELTTGADGTVMQSWEGTWGQVKAFGIAGKSVASSEALPGATVAWGYQMKGYVYTDRPVYRPNQSVNWKAILRNVGGGYYTTTAGEKVKVEVRAPNGLVLYEGEHQTTEYGTVTGATALGDEPALGTYTVKATIAEKDFVGTFQVLEYKKPEMTVDIVAEKEAYVAGEEVKAKVQVAYTFGGPVRNAQVVYRVETGPYAFDRIRYEEFGWYVAALAAREKQPNKEGVFVEEGRATTDASGVAEIRFRTRAGGDDTTYTIVAAVQDANRQWVTGASGVPATSVEAFAVVKTPKRLLQPKERVTVSVLTVNALHSPVAREGKVVVLRVREVDGHEVMDPISDYDTKTDDAGKAEVQVAIDKPGAYVIRFVSGKVEGGTPIEIAGDAEDLAKEAKVVADRTAYLRDETARVLVNSPAAGVTALLTFEADKVLEYRIVELADRSTTLEIPMKDLYAPNVTIAIAIPSDHKLYQASQEVLVFKYLNVKVEPAKKDLKPREEATFVVRTTDQNGKPVSGEFSLALVDEAIYAIAGENAPNLLAHFYDQKRVPAVVTRSSYEWNCQGVTVQTAADLILEGERKQLEETLSRNMDSLAKEAQLAAPAKAPPAPKPANEPEESDDFKRQKGDSQGYVGSLSPEGGESDHNESADSGDINQESLAFSWKDEDAPAQEKALGGLNKGKIRGRGPGSKDARKMDDLVTVWSAGKGGTIASAWGDIAGRRYADWVTPELRKEFADTAFWAGTLTTDENGLATVNVKLPDNLTTWRATVRGITRDTLVGSATAKVTTKKDVVARVAAPRFLTQNDEATVTGTVNNALTTDQRVKYIFRAEGVETETVPAEERPVAAGEVLAIDHAVRAMTPGHVTLHVEGLTTVESDAVEIGIETLPHGVREVEGASGTVDDRAMVDFTLPDDTVDGATRTELRLAPSIDASILDALIYLQEFPYGCIEQTLNRFAPGVQALRALQQTGAPNEALAKQLDGIVKEGLLRVNQLQNADGGWGWWAGNASDPFTTAYTLVCLEEVRRAGYAINGTVREKAVIGAKQLLANAGTDHDTRAYLLYALSYSEEADADEAMRTFRQRDALSDYGAAVLCLALKAMHRDPNAAQVVEMLVRRANQQAGLARADGPYAHWGAREDKYGWLDEGIEATAYALLAVIETSPTDPVIDRAAQWLIDRRPAGTNWGSTKATAAAIRALSAYVQLKGVVTSDYELTATLNDQPLGSWKVVHGVLPAEARRIEIPFARVHGGKNTLRLEKSGSGRVLYTLRAEYYRKGEDVQPVGNLVAVGRRYEAWTPPGSQAQATMSGYDVVQPERRPKVVDTGLREVVTADRVRIHLTIDSRQELSYVIVEDPLPSGCEVIDEGMTGGFDHQERRDEKMAFFFTKIPAGKTEITYQVQAVFPGKYHVMPTWVSPMYRPEIFGRGPEHRLEILSEREAQARKAQAAAEELPDEVYANGKKAWNEGRAGDAKGAFRKLLDRGDLRDEIAEELLGVLLSVALGEKDHRGAIASFEELMDRNPNTGVRIGDLREIAVAYDEEGEDERALGLYDRVLASTYEAELGGVNALAALGRTPDAEARWEKTLAQYPERSWTVDAEWSLVQLRLRDAETSTAVEPRKRAIQALRGFLAWNPNSGFADDADYALLSLVQKIGTVKGGLAPVAAEGLASEAERFLTRYPDSPYADEAENALLIGEFSSSHFDKALAAGEALLTRLYPDDAGVRRESPYRDSAHYLMGKVYHVQGDLAKAVEHYRLSTVGDAHDSLAFLTSKGLTLPATAYFGEKEGLMLAVQAKNLPEATLKVYKVDLMVLLASRKDLANAAKVDLTGIAPLKEWTAPLGENQYRWRDQSVEVPVEGKGAYLVVAKGQELDASSVMIRTEIALKVQKVENRVRVYVTDRAGKEAVKDAYVKVSDGTRIIAAGYTDARGVFEAGLQGAPGLLSIVAEHGDDVALIRE